MRHLLTFVFLLLAAGSAAGAGLSPYDLNAPFGWACCTSLTSGDDYRLTGGGNGKTITLKSDGQDMRNRISNAIRDYDVVILDGSGGDFTLSSYIQFKWLSNKTVVGINGARLCTQWYVTDEIKKLMDDNKVKTLSGSSGTGGTLSNGVDVNEECEWKTRQLMIDHTGDATEAYRKSGIFTFNECSNIILRNIDFVGPGSIDVGGCDLLSILNKSTHVWVDHCRFTDGIDGNFDITKEADFVTVSWCVFQYTERSYVHQYTNLIGSSSSNTSDEDKLNTTFFANIWGEGCKARMPMANFGTIHLLNNYYNCPGAGGTVNPCINSEFVIENNYWAKGVKKCFSQSGAKAYVWKGDNYFSEAYTPTSVGSVNLPYAYQGFNFRLIPRILTEENGAGPTLSDPLKIGREDAISSVQSDGELSFDGKNVCGNGRLEVFSLTGERMLTAENSFDTGELPKGCYLVRCREHCVKIVCR